MTTDPRRTPPSAGAEPPVDDADLMCPNCVTPWKCNGPHLVNETPHARRSAAAAAPEDRLQEGVFHVWYRRSPSVPERVERAAPDTERVPPALTLARLNELHKTERARWGRDPGLARGMDLFATVIADELRAAQAGPPPLDVERLHVAADHMNVAHQRWVWEKVAAEYARLAAAPEEGVGSGEGEA